MNRSEFLKNLGIGAGGLLLPNPYVTGLPVKIYDNFLRGVNHYQYKKLASSIQEGDSVLLSRDVSNVHDSFAVAVHCEKLKLGYLAAYENVVIANLLDAGVNLTAFVSRHHPKAPVYQVLAIEIFTDLVRPTDKLIQSTLTDKRADEAPDLYRQYHPDTPYRYTLE